MRERFLEKIEKKHKLRRDMLLLRQQIPEDLRLQREAKAYEFVENLCNENLDKYMATYRALAGEFNLDPFTFNNFEKWVFPKVIGDELSFYHCKDIDDFEAGSFGVSEPASSQPEVSLMECSMVFVPGVAFDHKGRRLGMGKGFYDRALKGYKGLKVGVAYACQLLDEELPFEDHDIVMDYVITEKFILSPIQHKRTS